MNLTLTAFDALVGLVTGILAGFLGIGGGLIAVPYFLWKAGATGNLSSAVLLGVLSTLPICLASSCMHRASARSDSDLLRVVDRTKWSATFTAFVASVLTMGLPEQITSVAFSAMVGLAAWGSITGKLSAFINWLTPLKRRYAPDLNSGVLAGLGGGLVGGGGAFLTVPYLATAQNLGLKRAISGSAILTVFIMGGASCAALARMIWQPPSANVLIVVAMFAASGVVGVFAGLKLSKHATASLLKKLFGIYMAVLAVYIAMRPFMSGLPE